MRAYVVTASIAIAVVLGGLSGAWGAQVDPNDIEHLFKSLQGQGATERPETLYESTGFIRFVGTPPGTLFFPTSKGFGAESVARAFLTENLGIFGSLGERTSFVTERISSHDGMGFVRLQQQYNGIPVYAGEMVIQTNNDKGGVACAYAKLLRDTEALDTGILSLSPTITATAARQIAIAWAADKYEVSESSLVTDAVDRYVFEPSVVGAPGVLCVVWRVVVQSLNSAAAQKDALLIDVRDGTIMFHEPLVYEALNRFIYDSNNQYDLVGTLARSEGQAPSVIPDANAAYDQLGATYSFFMNYHDRDSIDGAGMPLIGHVRVCYYGCPMDNAFWSGSEMFFGDGFAVDDVTAHELTHGVTDYESNLIYANQSGAINEAFSDAWGEWVDLTDGIGNDSSAIRWYMGEDLPSGAIRYMKNPPSYGDPDRLSSPYYYNGQGDNGGVHINSGVINKLTYLLTDGDSFNGQTVEGIGIDKTAKLYYEMQTHLLTSSSDFYDFYYLMRQAALNLEFTFAERLNVRAAGRAVEINPPDETEQGITQFRAIAAVNRYNRPVIALKWLNPDTASLRQMVLVRSTTGYPTSLADGVQIYAGRDEKYLDTLVETGTTYYYTIFEDLYTGFPESRSTRCRAGLVAPSFLTEEFFTSNTPANPFDLSFSQLLFTPTGSPSAGIGSTQYADYSNYMVTRRVNTYALPVSRTEGKGDAISTPMTEDGFAYWSLPIVFPYMGELYSHVFVASNGYIVFQKSDSYPLPYTSDNFPSLAAHFSSPRLSFLFSDLSPVTSGSVWVRYLDDRFVITFENVAEFSYATPNTVQVELFYSGHIRVTYMDVTARHAVVGLSDGNGVAIDPSTLFPGLRSVTTVATDFSAFDTTVTGLSVDPVGPQSILAGEELTFSVQTRYPSYWSAPSLSASWDGVGPVPFADNRDGTGVFHWQTSLADYGSFTVRIAATLGDYVAYQDIAVNVGIISPLPTVRNLLLRTSNPIEDPSRNRTVSDDVQLFAEYEYMQPSLDGASIPAPEGPTILLWYRNNQLVSTFNNLTMVPASATHPNDQWFFTVTPLSSLGERGMTRVSPLVTIVALPEVDHVVRLEDLPAPDAFGNYPDTMAAAFGPTTGETNLVLLGRRLGHPVSVKVGGIEATGIRVVGDTRLEVTTPAHAASPVVGGVPIPEDITVQTDEGVTIKREVFTYVDAGDPVFKADVNGDGKVDAVDVQLVILAVLETAKSAYDADVNRDGRVNSNDLQLVLNLAVGK